MIRLLGQGPLYHINRNRQWWTIILERRRKAFRYCVAIGLCIVIIIVAWLARPKTLDNRERSTEVPREAVFSRVLCLSRDDRLSISFS